MRISLAIFKNNLPNTRPTPLRSLTLQPFCSEPPRSDDDFQKVKKM